MTKLNTKLGLRGIWLWLTPPAVDFLLFYAALTLSLLYRQSRMINGHTGTAFFPLILIWMAILYGLEFYELRVVRNFTSLVRSTVASVGLCLASGAIYFYLAAPYVLLTPKRNLAMTVLLAHALIVVWRRIWLWMIHFNMLDQRIVFLADETHVKEIETKLGEHFRGKGLHIVPWHPGVDMVVADSRWVDDHWTQGRAIFMAAVKHGVPIVSIETFYELIFGKVSPEYAANPSWTLEFILPKTTGLYWKVKRLCDVVGAGALLLATSPFIALTAALIALTDRSGPIFYGHVRAGLLGRPFTLWKFRSMSVGADASGPFAAEGVRRSQVTRLGAVLRRFRLDELPQLWNVLRGDMSLVGPRPAEWRQEVEILGKVVPGYHLRHLVYPGITGWAQLNFRAAYNVEDSLEKIHYDLYYVKYLSFSLDLSILLRTIKRVFVNDLHVETTPRPAIAPRASAEWAGDLRELGRAAA